jgi:WD40 repeat protein
MRNTLEDHLAALRRANRIQTWHDLQLEAGTEWEPAILNKLDTADIILLLVSHNFIASEYCYGNELKRAIARHDEGTARVIPIILSSCDWNHPDVPFSKLNALPTPAKPIKNWADPNDAFTIVAQRIRETVQSLTKELEEKEVQKNLELEKVQSREQPFLQTPNEDLSLDEHQVDQISLEQILSSLDLEDIGQGIVLDSSKEVIELPLPQREKPKKQNRNTSTSRKILRDSEELEEAIDFVGKAYTRRTRKPLSEAQRAIVQGAWHKCSYEDIANNCKSNATRLESSGRRLWEILSESLGEKVNKSNFRVVIKDHLQRKRTPIIEDGDRKSTSGRASIQICEYVNTLSGHSGWVNSIVISSNRQIISGSQDKTVKIWNLDTAKYLRDFGGFLYKGHSNRVNSVAISSDSRVLASASEDGTVIVWNLENYRKIHQLRHQGAVRCITISPDNQFLASGCSNRKVYIWNLVTGKSNPRSEREAIKALVFSPDGQTLIGATEDKIVKTWTLQNWSYQNLPIDYESSPDSLALSENGNLLAISCSNRKIKLIDLHRKEQLYSLSGQVVALSPDCEILATALDKEISLWKLETGELICPSVRAGNLVRSLAFSQDGLTLVSGQGEEIKIWQIRKDKLPS